MSSKTWIIVDGNNLVETWKSVIGYEGYYEVSNIGRVRSVARRVSAYVGGYRDVPSCILQPSGSESYLSVNLSKGGMAKSHRIHVLVAKAFVPNPEKRPQVNHIDTNKRNNHYTNLEWRIRKGNAQHASDNGCIRKGAAHEWAVLSEDDVRDIKRRLKTKEVQRRIAEFYNVDPGTISSIKLGKSWKHIKE